VLSESEVESLKILQTILLLVTTTEIVSGQHLAKVSHMSAYTLLYAHMLGGFDIRKAAVAKRNIE